LIVFTEMISYVTDPLHLLAQMLLRKVAHVNEVDLDVFKDRAGGDGLNCVPILALRSDTSAPHDMSDRGGIG